MSKNVINRVDQLDALMIDNECKDMLFSQLLKVFDYLGDDIFGGSPQNYRIRYEDELRLIHTGKFKKSYFN